MVHECEKCKSDKMQDLLLDRNGIFSCRSCGKNVEEKDIHPKILKLFERKNILKWK